MTSEQFQTLLAMLSQQTLVMERLANAVERLGKDTAAPNYTCPLEDFKTFNWESIGGSVERSDQYGPAIVSWGGQQFIRRSPTNKFGEAIWYSRCVGKDETGENRYERLITFKPLSKIEVEPLPDGVARRLLKNC